jgi:hypothetical protein
MSGWRTYRIYHGDVDGLIVGCVHPFLAREGHRVERRFWERHFAGGPHLRVRLRGSPAALDAVGGELAAEARRYLAAHPSPPSAGYSPQRAAALLALEGEAATEDELRYRSDEVVEAPGGMRREAFATDEGLALAEDFRHDVEPLAASLVAGPGSREEALLRLYLFQALFLCGDVAEGCVSYRSHWEGFATSAAPAVVARIRETYERGREGIAALLREVERAFRGEGEADPTLEAWHGLLRAYAARAERTLAQGGHLTEQPRTPAEVARIRGDRDAYMGRHGRFVRTLVGDERFIASLQFEPAFLVPRILTNLLYVLVAAAGLSPIHRMALCHHAHRAAEDHTGRDLADILAGNVERVVTRNAHRWDAPTSAESLAGRRDAMPAARPADAGGTADPAGRVDGAVSTGAGHAIDLGSAESVNAPTASGAAAPG